MRAIGASENCFAFSYSKSLLFNSFNDHFADTSETLSVEITIVVGSVLVLSRQISKCTDKTESEKAVLGGGGGGGSGYASE